MLDRLLPWRESVASYALIRRKGQPGDPSKVNDYDRERSPREVELEEDLAGGVYVLQKITDGGTFSGLCWQESLFGGPGSDRDRRQEGTDADPEEVAELAAQRLAEEIGGGDGSGDLQIPPPEPGSTKEWMMMYSFLNPDLVGDQFASAAKQVGEAAGEGFWNSVDDSGHSHQTQQAQTSPVQESAVDEGDDQEGGVDPTTAEVGIVGEEPDGDDADLVDDEDDAETFRCEFPTPNGPCQNEVDGPDGRCWIESHAMEDEAAAVEAQAEQAETIDEYPTAEDAIAAQGPTAVADGGEKQ